MDHAVQPRVAFWCLLCLMLIFWCAITGAAQSLRAAQYADTQSWNDFQFTVPLNKEIDMIVLGGLRIGRNITHPIDERLGVNLKFNVGKYLTLTPGYQYIRTQPAAGRNDRENKFSFAATPRVPFKRYTLTDRNLFERRIRNPQVDATRYRNRLQIEVPFKPQKSKWLFFASDEVFYDWSFNDWVRNRFSVGVRKTFTKKLAVDFYYLRQNDGRSRPGDLNVIGTLFRLSR